MRSTSGKDSAADPAALDRRVGALEGMDLLALRREWVRVVKTSPQLRLSADLLRRGIAHRLQETAFGRCPPSTLRRLAAAAHAGPSGQQAGAAPKAGTTLVREWHGRTHTVRVVEDGYEYGGRHYASLTKIAREVTGAAWSGPRFFGLVRAAGVGRRATTETDGA